MTMARQTDLDRPAVDDAAMSQNVPFCPTSAADGSPILPPDGLTPAQRLAVAALVSGHTLSSAALRAGVDRRTLARWRGQPAFAAAVTDLSREALDASAARARNLMLTATRLLAESLRGNDRFNYAFRVASNKRLWDVGEKCLTTPPPDAPPADENAAVK